MFLVWLRHVRRILAAAARLFKLSRAALRY